MISCIYAVFLFLIFNFNSMGLKQTEKPNNLIFIFAIISILINRNTVFPQLYMVACEFSLFSMVACEFSLFSMVACEFSLFSMVACEFPLFSMVACEFSQFSMVACEFP